MDGVRCVVNVSQITEHPNWWKRQSEFKGNAKTIEFGGLMHNDKNVPPELADEIKKFWDASPQISLKLSCINPEANKYLEVDGIYELTFRRIGTMQRPE